jgi:thiamine kinase-like enzyme
MHEEVSPPELTEAIARLSALLGPRQGGVLLLEGGITNRNFRVNFGGDDYVVRLPGKDTALLGIDREAERLATREAAALGLGPRVAAMLDKPAALVTCFIHGRGVSSEELRAPEALRAVGEGLARFHGSGLELPVEFDAVQTARRYLDEARRRGAEAPAGAEDALGRAGELQTALRGRPGYSAQPCHNDLLGANFLRDDGSIAIVDWEYAGLGDPLFDLGNFAVNNELSEADEELLLHAYLGEPPTPPQLAAVRLYRFVSDLREAMWGLLQSAVSELPFDFAGYSARHFERSERTAGDSRFGDWRVAAAAT